VAEELDPPLVAAVDDEDDDPPEELDLDELEQAAPTRLSTSSGTARVRAFTGRIMGRDLLVARGMTSRARYSRRRFMAGGNLRVKRVASVDGI